MNILSLLTTQILSFAHHTLSKYSLHFNLRSSNSITAVEVTEKTNYKQETLDTELGESNEAS